MTTELLANFVEKDKEHEQDESVKAQTVELLYLQMFIKVHAFFEIPGKHDYFQSVLMYMLAKKFIKYPVKNGEELFFGLFALMLSQDMLRKAPFFFPEAIICFERIASFFVNEIKEKDLKFDKSLFDINDKNLNQGEVLTIYKQIYEGVRYFT